jgi:hypothetical protein
VSFAQTFVRQLLIFLGGVFYSAAESSSNTAARPDNARTTPKRAPRAVLDISPGVSREATFRERSRAGRAIALAGVDISSAS